MVNELMQDLALNASVFGTLIAFYYNIYAPLQLPAGFLIDKFGPRQILLYSTLVCFLGCSFFAMSSCISLAIFGRALIGAGAAFAFLSCLKVATIWFSPERFSFFVGMTLLLGTSGAIGGGAPLSLLVEKVGWRYTMWILGCIGLVIHILVLLIVREKKQENKQIIEATVNETFLKSILFILRKKQSWIIASYGILMYAPISAFCDIWGVKFLEDVYKIDSTTAAACVSGAYIGLGLGSPIFSNYIKSYDLSLKIAAIGTTSLLLVIIYSNQMPSELLSILFFLLGVFSAGQVSCFSVVCSINPLKLSATATGFHNMMCMSSGAIFQPFIGFLIDICAFNNNSIISKYMFSLSIIPIGTTIAFFITYLISKTSESEAYVFDFRGYFNRLIRNKFKDV